METADKTYEKKALLLVNPVAGRKMIQRSLTQVIRELMDAGYLVTTAVTAQRNEARSLAASLGGGFDLIVCAGGDGTLNECASGMAEAGWQVPLGYIPRGSTNDFALSHDLPGEILPAAEVIAAGRRRAFDLGCFEERFFLHHALFGAFTRMAYSTDQAQKNMLGYGAYVLDGLKELSNLKPIRLRVTAGAQTLEGENLFGTVSTNRYIAGIYTLPEETIAADDGRLVMLLIKAPKSVPEWDGIVRSILLADPDCPMVEILAGEEFVVETPEGLEWSLDGESSGVRTLVHLRARAGFLTLQG
jgi:YegS/Rv2252/BmrU family lipid kinase